MAVLGPDAIAEGAEEGGTGRTFGFGEIGVELRGERGAVRVEDDQAGQGQHRGHGRICGQYGVHIRLR